MSQKKPESQKILSILRRVTEVTTDKDGKLIQPIRQLESKTGYVLCDDAPVRPAKTMTSREEVVEWIDKCVLGDLRTVRLGIEEREKRDKRGGAKSSALGGGNFLLAACCCMAPEYFGQVYGKGTNATESVQKYVERFLTIIDSRYKEFWPVLWRSFRNGIIHGSWPQYIRMQDSSEEEQIAMRANNSPNGDHLDRASDHSDKSFAISSYRFSCDIEDSFNIEKGFRDWLLHEPGDGVLERSAPRRLEIKNGDNEGKKAFNATLRRTTQTPGN